MAAMLQLKILSPTRTVFNGQVTLVTFPGGLGSFSVLPSHAPIISTLVKGDIVCHPPGGEKKTISINGGFVEVKENQIIACIEQPSISETEKNQT